MKLNKSNIQNIFIPLLLFLVAFFWKLYFVDSRDICGDEPFTIFHAQKSALDILKLPAQNEPNPPLFMFILHFWMKWFGNSTISIRILPLLFNALTAVFLYLSGKKIANFTTGLLASGLFMFSTLHFYFGLETRAYSMLSFATAASLYYFLSIIKNPDNRLLVVSLIISNVFLIYSHYFGWFVIFSQFLSVWIYFRNKKAFKQIIIALLITGILFLPMAPVFIKQFLTSSKGTWVQPPENIEFIAQLKGFLNNHKVFLLLGFATYIAFFYQILVIQKIRFNKTLITLIIWWFLPYTTMFLASQKVPMFINRYILFNTIGLYLTIAYISFIYLKKSKYLHKSATAIVLLIMLSQMQINSKEFYYREVKNSVAQVNKHYNINSLVIIHPHWAHLGFIYYFDNEIFTNISDIESTYKNKNIFPVWGLENVKQTLKSNPDKKVIYYQDGSLLMDNNNSIFKYLDSCYTRLDSVFYPQTFYVSTFEPKNN